MEKDIHGEIWEVYSLNSALFPLPEGKSGHANPPSGSEGAAPLPLLCLPFHPFPKSRAKSIPSTLPWIRMGEEEEEGSRESCSCWIWEGKPFPGTQPHTGIILDPELSFPPTPNPTFGDLDIEDIPGFNFSWKSFIG